MSERGYADWKPKADALYWVRAVMTVLNQFKDDWPLTNRQLFYRLVADYQFEKTEQAYNRLTGYISRARRAGMLPWDAIRDGGLGRVVDQHHWDGEDDFIEGIRRAAEQMRLNRQEGQEQILELWCEAGGMVPILVRAGQPYGIRVNSGGGYDSVTAKHGLAGRVCERAERGLRTVILHVGDFDPSGEDMPDVLREDAGAMAGTQILRSAVKVARDFSPDGEKFAGAPWADFLEAALVPEEGNDVQWGKAVRWAMDFFDVRRIALTPEQVVERGIETAPPKRSDSRMNAFVERNEWVAEELGTPHITAQLEALSPPELRELLTETIEEHLDMDQYAAVLEEEERIREALLERLP